MTMTKLHCPTCGVEIDEHEAGRCLDAWAGEVVMGWTKQKPGHGPCCTCQVCGWGHDDIDGTCLCGFQPSYYIAAAWMLVEKLVNDSLSPTVFWDDGDDKPEHAVWAACIAHYGETEGEFWLCDGFADTAPLAITRAAIKASLKGTEK